MNSENFWYIFFLLVITMSVNSGQNVWTDMLLDIQQRAAFWLKQIHKRTDVTGDAFQQMFLRAVNNR